MQSYSEAELKTQKLGQREKANPGPSVSKTRRILGWIAVGFSIAISSVWAYWGISEAFHEGWHMGNRL
jgi:hypothetical protein